MNHSFISRYKYFTCQHSKMIFSFASLCINLRLISFLLIKLPTINPGNAIEPKEQKNSAYGKVDEWEIVWRNVHQGTQDVQLFTDVFPLKQV